METSSTHRPLERFDLQPDPLLSHLPDRIDNELFERFDEEVLEGDHIVPTGEPRVVVRPASQEELVHDEEEEFPAVPRDGLQSSRDFRNAILREAGRRGILDPDDHSRALTDVPVRVFLEPRFRSRSAEESFPFVTNEVRRERRARRAAELLEHYQEIVPALEELGATVLERSTLISMLTVDVPPASLSTILDAHDWRNASAFLTFQSDFAAFTGEEIRLALENETFYANGYDGGELGSLDPVRVGVIDTFNFNSTHVGWNRSDGSGGWTTRLMSSMNCVPNPCVAYSPSDPGVVVAGTNPPVTEPSHGTAVAWTMVGSIMDGQHPGLNVTVRRQRSGVARDVDIYYYRMPQMDGGATLPRIIEHAIDNDVSVLNASWWNGCNGCPATLPNGQFDMSDPCLCDTAMDCGGMNAALQEAAAENVMFIKSAGNRGDFFGALECSLGYPAQRSESIAVAAVDSSNTNWESYATADLRAASSSGPVPVGTLGSAILWLWRGVDLAAPGCIGQSFHWNQSQGYHMFNSASGRPDGLCGTSFSAPQVSGQAALQHQAHRARSNSTASSHWRRVGYLLISGDATNTSGDGLSARAFVRNYGAGRIRAYAPSYTPGPRLWKATTRTLGNAQTNVVNIRNLQPMLPGYQWVSVVAVRPEPDLSSVARMVLRLYDVCPPGGGEILLRSSSFSADLRLRVELRDTEVVNRCLQARVTALGNWGAETRVVDVVVRGESFDPWF